MAALTNNLPCGHMLMNQKMLICYHQEVLRKTPKDIRTNITSLPAGKAWEATRGVSAHLGGGDGADDLLRDAVQLVQQVGGLQAGVGGRRGCVQLPGHHPAVLLLRPRHERIYHALCAHKTLSSYRWHWAVPTKPAEPC